LLLTKPLLLCALQRSSRAVKPDEDGVVTPATKRLERLVHGMSVICSPEV